MGMSHFKVITVINTLNSCQFNALGTNNNCPLQYWYSYAVFEPNFKFTLPHAVNICCLNCDTN